jgi:hypothetical protein
MEQRYEFKLKDLVEFSGSTVWVRHPLAKEILFTEGVLFLAVQAKALWLLDEIVLAQKAKPELKKEDFQVWDLKVTGSSAILRCDDGNDHLLWEMPIPFTDFPEPGVKLYFTDYVIMLPSEY